MIKKYWCPRCEDYFKDTHDCFIKGKCVIDLDNKKYLKK